MMTATKKYSYKDWWCGNISLIYATICYKSNEAPPLLINWEQIVESDIIKIKEKQEVYFNKDVYTYLLKWKDDFLNRTKFSEDPDILLARELIKFKEITLGPIIAGITINIEGIIFDANTLSEIKNYINSKINGTFAGYDFVQSPNCPYRNPNKIPNQVYAQCCWSYLKWLENFDYTKENESDPEFEMTSLQTDDIKEPYNPNTEIFKNGYAYNLFIELKQAIVLPNTKLADYGFIYHFLKHGELKAINKGVSHDTFINYLNNKHDAMIKTIKLVNTNTPRKTNIANNLIENYRAHI